MRPIPQNASDLESNQGDKILLISRWQTRAKEKSVKIAAPNHRCFCALNRLRYIIEEKYKKFLEAKKIFPC